MFGELIIYAKTYCVSLAEAKRRMEIQNRDAVGAQTDPGEPPAPPADGIGALSQRIEANDKATFAGLWIQHEPKYGVVVARGEVKLPPYVDIREPPPIRLAPPPNNKGVANPVKAFPRVNYRGGGPELAILRTGMVLLDGGCLRLKEEKKGPVIAWPNEAALDLVSEKGKVRIMNRMSGERVGLDERIVLGSNATLLPDEANVIDKDAACPGPYYAIANFGSYAPHEASQLEGRAGLLSCRPKPNHSIWRGRWFHGAIARVTSARCGRGAGSGAGYGLQ